MFGKQVLYCLYICLVLVVWLLSAISLHASRLSSHVLQLGLAKTKHIYIYIYTVCMYCS